MLAQSLLDANMDLYEHCPEDYLKWSHRKWNLFRELLDSQATILCLQEIDEEVYHSWLYPQLKSKGYIGIYKKRTGARKDGCAIFFQESVFFIEYYVAVEFRKNCRVLDRDNVGIVLVLRSVSHPQHAVCVATTHILFNPKAGEVKLAQVSLLLAEIHRAVTRPGCDHAGCPVIICGDFNMMPLCPLYHFLVRGGLDYTRISAPQVARHGRSTSRKIPFPLFPPELGIGNASEYVQNMSSMENGESKGKSCTAEPPVCTSVTPACHHQSSVSPGSQRYGFAATVTEPIPSVQLGSPIPVLTQPPGGNPRPLQQAVPGNVGEQYCGGRPPFSSRVPQQGMTNSLPYPLYYPVQGCGQVDMSGVGGRPRMPVLPPRPLLPSPPALPNRLPAMLHFPPAPRPAPATTYRTPALPTHCLPSGEEGSTVGGRASLPTARHSSSVPPERLVYTRPQQPPWQARTWLDGPRSGCDSSAREAVVPAKQQHLITHPFQLASAYPYYHPANPRDYPSSATTYHGQAFENADYMFYTPENLCSGQSRLVLLERLELPSTHAFLETGPMPNSKGQSSDHVMICASFALLSPHHRSQRFQ